MMQSDSELDWNFLLFLGRKRNIVTSFFKDTDMQSSSNKNIKFPREFINCQSRFESTFIYFEMTVSAINKIKLFLRERINVKQIKVHSGFNRPVISSGSFHRIILSASRNEWSMSVWQLPLARAPSCMRKGERTKCTRLHVDAKNYV